jgi:hypothetical protein
MRSPRRVTLAPIDWPSRILKPAIERRALVGDLGEVAHGAVEQATLADRLAHAHVHHDLDRPRHLHDVAEPQLVPEPLLELLPVARLEARHRPLCRRLRHPSSFFL